MKIAQPTATMTRGGDLVAKTPEGADGLVTYGLTYLPTGTAVIDAATSLSVKVAAKLAVAEVLLGLRAFDVSSAAVLAGNPTPGPHIELRRNAISIDWPDAGVEHAPLKLTIREGEEGMAFEDLGISGPDYLDETENVYGPGTILVHTHDVRGTIVIEATLASGGARDALEAALDRMFGIEPNDFRTGRRIAFRAYYDRDVRMTLAKVPFQSTDVPGAIQSNDWDFSCFLEVELPNVRLVKSPGVVDTVDLPIR